ncbi:outer membrane protein [Aquimonas sp.]|jgi:opacity protein-like surface antigen|uniref:outer membrane protein n=1 Tax=Aquimonas sp. TaxID=1872588 RepID=UPI0037C05320
MTATHKPSLLALLSACLWAATPSPAAAAERGWYAGVLTGLSGQSDQTLRLEGSAPETGKAAFSSGLLAGGAVGYRFESGWRLETEFTYQSVDRDRAVFSNPALQGEGNYASTGFALNALYEFDLFGSPRARSYLGAGVVALTEVDIDFETTAGERSFSGDDSALQLLAGVRYDLGERWFLDLGLRQLRASSLRLEGERDTLGRVRGDYRPWSLTLGAGWRF